MTAEWLCTRCATKLGKETESDPVILRECSNCGIENWVRPFGHAGANVVAEDIEIVGDVVVESVLEDITPAEEEEPEPTEREKEIEALKAKLAELEK